jgi:hypothetical protein
VKEQATYNGVTGAHSDLGVHVPLVVGGLSTRVAPETCQAGIRVLLERVGLVVVKTVPVSTVDHVGVPVCRRHGEGKLMFV